MKITGLDYVDPKWSAMKPLIKQGADHNILVYDDEADKGILTRRLLTLLNMHFHLHHKCDMERLIVFRIDDDNADWLTKCLTFDKLSVDGSTWFSPYGRWNANKMTTVPPAETSKIIKHRGMGCCKLDYYPEYEVRAKIYFCDVLKCSMHGKDENFLLAQNGSHVLLGSY
jgi:hypothetical protein